ncbi:MAG: RsmE family RNA methyltransferase [Candidatus Omnitrophota bacterium]
MHRFFCNSQDITKDTLNITDLDKVHHIRDVLRIKKNEVLSISDEKNNAYLCRIEEFYPERIRLKIKARIKEKDSGVSLAVACAIPKKVKMDDIIDKLTQLGVSRIIPMRTSRVIVKWGTEKEHMHLERWRKIAQSAAEQSQGNYISAVDPVMNIEEVIGSFLDYDLKLIPALFGRRQDIKDVLAQNKPGKVIALIGPEGDFSGQEMRLAQKNGFIPITLGTRVLRVDTAAIALAASVLIYANH